MTTLTNYIINKKRPNSHIEEISVNDKQYRQPSSIGANALNNYFCNVASDLATSLPKSNRHCRSYLTKYRNKFEFTQISELSEVEVFLLTGGALEIVACVAGPFDACCAGYNTLSVLAPR